MASLDELTEAIGDSLRARGVSDAIKARLRAEVFGILEGEGTPRAPRPSSETLIINELIRDYLDYNGYSHSLSVFEPETGQPKDESLPRSVLAEDLGLSNRRDFREDLGRPLPLLYDLVRASRERQNSSAKQDQR
mmetsp:Transcript_12044/g.23561  ORF Transcript_12044/g.23561 Transcript_12044/m.23561 type:complete len:135 (-) Transcript_12044:543-947(-)